MVRFLLDYSVLEGGDGDCLMVSLDYKHPNTLSEMKLSNTESEYGDKEAT